MAKFTESTTKPTHRESPKGERRMTSNLVLAIQRVLSDVMDDDTERCLSVSKRVADAIMALEVAEIAMTETYRSNAQQTSAPDREPFCVAHEWYYMGGRFQIKDGQVLLLQPTQLVCLTILAMHRCIQYAIEDEVFTGGDRVAELMAVTPSMRANDFRVSFRPGVLEEGTKSSLVTLGFVDKDDEWAWQDIRTPLQMAEALSR